jgi:hypothetical protein
VPGPKFVHQVRIETPTSPTVDPATGLQSTTPASTVTTRAWLSQRPTNQLASAVELTAEQHTTVGLYTILLPPGTQLTSSSRVTDLSGVVNPPGAVLEVEGQPATRYSPMARRVQFIAASLRLVSDMQ